MRHHIVHTLNAPVEFSYSNGACTDILDIVPQFQLLYSRQLLSSRRHLQQFNTSTIMFPKNRKKGHGLNPRSRRTVLIILREILCSIHIRLIDFPRRYSLTINCFVFSGVFDPTPPLSLGGWFVRCSIQFWRSSGESSRAIMNHFPVSSQFLCSLPYKADSMHLLSGYG